MRIHSHFKRSVRLRPQMQGFNVREAIMDKMQQAKCTFTFCLRNCKITNNKKKIFLCKKSQKNEYRRKQLQYNSGKLEKINLHFMKIKHCLEKVILILKGYLQLFLWGKSFNATKRNVLKIGEYARRKKKLRYLEKGWSFFFSK